MEIPKRFLQRHGRNLPDSVYLKVPSSTTVWPVELEWSDGMARLAQGWQKFTDYYSIDFGQVLVFRYEPSSVFHVVIFDTSASEIEYPTGPVIMGKSEPECELPLLKKEETDDISAKILEDCRPSPNIRKKSKSALASRKVNSGMIRKSASRASPATPVARRCNVPCPAALEMARDFKSKHPTFILVVYPSYIKNSTVSVPAEFMRTHIKRSVQVVTLKHEKYSWPVKLTKFPRDHGKLSQGWSAFARATSLCEGDVCVFELTKQSPAVLLVSIFRSSDYT
ncbi:B3 domain-containing transcription factor VRN1-like isoform X1 [Syzygium oleosum]|uniref:B3 domain-containing transcription factor VRN1-like isoform X1 n=2 Tax=Syzygium oleosum TaxID=219896 RepID=UPI0024B88C4D|nr:B3 domain-containing transcription factor VRN1-like isoform X1 [Syzygium oleosum]